MNPWREVLKALQAELDRLSQEIEGRSVLPNGVTAALPAARFERWAPILEAVTAELGEALVSWVEASRRVWYAGRGPFLTVQLDGDRTQTEITCEFLKSPPGESPATEEELVAPEVPVIEPGPVATEASWEPDSGGDAGDGDSTLGRIELDALGEMPVSSQESREDEDRLSQLELD